ncbi:MAG: DeoR/GlpR transcriptional regulator [Methylocystaceae bacterium]|nr:DeoR/GlpR transcriptional regulator [Methylocystaceae bacterium]
MWNKNGLNIRQQDIAEWLHQVQSATIQDLSDQFRVSDETIRRDLRHLSENGLVEKFHGGVRFNVPSAEAPFKSRMRVMAQEKSQIAVRAAKLIENEATVFLDNSSTACFLARQLAKRNDLTIITLSLEIANILSTGPKGNRVILSGGELRAEDQTLTGTEAINFITQFTPNMCFISVAAVSPIHGCMDFDLFESDFKRAVIPLADQVVLLSDHSKFDKSGLIKVCDLSAFNTLVTDQAVPKSVADKMKHGKIVVA